MVRYRRIQASRLCRAWIVADKLLRAYFFCAFESQNEGSLATHSAAGMLNSGRTAKILASGPAADKLRVCFVPCLLGLHYEPHAVPTFEDRSIAMRVAFRYCDHQESFLPHFPFGATA
jgi:hypothetical protein